MSRLANIGDGTDAYAAYKYMGAGKIVVEDYMAAGVKINYAADNFLELDRFGRVVDQIWERYGENPALLDEYVYEYDRAGNRTRKYNALNSDLNETYEYNALDELTSTVRNNGFDQSWTLDGLGNFSEFNDNGSSQTRDVNAANEITSTTGIATPTYDLAGNIISDGTQDYYYDAWNRQTYVALADDSPVALYVYDGVNRRIEKVLSGSLVAPYVHYYYNQNWQLLEERSETSNGGTFSTNQYVWSPLYVDSPVVRFHEVTDNPQYNNTLYYTNDANHNVTALINTSGAVVERYYYDAYGKTTICNVNWVARPDGFGGNGIPGDESAYGNEILYCGYFYDSETSQNASITIGTGGNYNVRHRYLSTQLGTFISRDPIGYRGGINLYEYVGDNPTNRMDPNGLQQKPGYGALPWPDFSPPPPTPGKGGANARRPGGIGYLLTCGCTSKKDRLSPIPGVVTPSTNPLSGTGAHTGQNQTYPFPANTAIGTGGAGSCNALIVKCPNFVSVFHFTVGDSPSGTLGRYSWPTGCEAIICGGDNSDQSNCLGDDVNNAAKKAGIKVVGVSGNSGCGVDANGNWYQYGN
jgi:RHS repeat-associated protein